MSGARGHWERTIADRERALRPREVKELLRLRGNLLVGEDRALLTMYLEGGETLRRIATLAAISPSSVARRIRAITQRLSDPTYPACLANRQRFSQRELRIIRDHFVRGSSIRSLHRQYHLGIFRIRTILRKARECASAANKMPPARRKDSCP
jgi:hypothetical protein